MQDNRSTILEDEFGDAALKLLLDEYSAYHGAQLLEEYQTQAKENCFSEELDKACTKRIQRKIYKDQLRKTASHFEKAAVIMVVCLCLSITMILSVEALRIPVLNFCLVRFPRFSQVLPQAAKTSEIVDFFTCLENNRISFEPEGYTLTQSEHSSASFFVVYKNAAEDTASIGVYNNEGVLNLNSENCMETQLTLNGMDVVHWKNTATPEQSVLLLDPGHGVNCFLYASNMSADEFWTFVYTFAAFL